MNRKIEDLVPDLQEKYHALVKLAGENNIGFYVTSTKRLATEQIALHAQGREKIEEVNKLRKYANFAPISERENYIVTWSLKSKHLSGKAFDVCISKSNPAAKEPHPDLLRLGELAEAIGLKWGGRFKTPDYCHFELQEKRV